MAHHTRYTRRRSPDTLALLVAAVLACLLCQAGWSAAFGDGLPQFAVGPRRHLLRDFTPLQKVRRGAAAAAGFVRAARRDGKRAARRRPAVALGPASSGPASARLLRTPRLARATPARVAGAGGPQSGEALKRARPALAFTRCRPRFRAVSLWRDLTRATLQFGAFWYFLGVLYILLGMSIVCEDYFVASLAALGEKFGLSDDVNGATLMAAGSSMPEVFSSFMALANSETDNSLGMVRCRRAAAPCARVRSPRALLRLQATIVGSSVYNILVIIGWSAIAGKDILLDWKPLVRDSVFYFITIIFLISTFTTGDIHFGNGFVAVLLYSCYVGFMTQNQKVFKKMDKLAEMYVPYLHRKTTERLARKGIAAGGGLVESDTELQPLAAEEGAAEVAEGTAADASAAAPAAGHGKEEEHEADHLVWPTDGTRSEKIKFCIKAPYFAVFKYTIPDCRTQRWKSYYALTFVCSIVWIGILAWYLVAWASHVACVLKIPDIIIGLTVLAAGTSLPDTLSSVIVARQGLGDMAVANAIGSNVFNVLFGLGFPWCLWILISGEKIVVPVSGLRENAFTMLLVGIFYMSVFTFRGFHMTSDLGRAFIAVYAAYVLMICIRFGIIDRPPESMTCV